MRKVLVVGGSIAAATAASTLRSDGFDGEIVLASAEAVPPYSRVPFSKAVLAGHEQIGTAYLPALPASIEMRLGQRAVAADFGSRTVTFADGRRERYDGLVVATGARARRLSQSGCGEHVVRDISDVETLLEDLDGAGTAIIVGSGFLGMELASALLQQGIAVTVVSRDMPLKHTLGDWLSGVVGREAARSGVSFETGSAGAHISRHGRGVILEDGRELTADLVISAIGDLPNVEWLGSAAHRGGLRPDGHGWIAPSVVAAGDVCSVFERGQWTRRPHWTNAIAQGNAAARGLLGEAMAHSIQEEYYWTEVFGLDIKISGALAMTGDPEVVDGDLSESRALLRWQSAAGSTAVSINYRIPIVKLKQFGSLATSPLP